MVKHMKGLTPSGFSVVKLQGHGMRLIYTAIILKNMIYGLMCQGVQKNYFRDK